MEEAVTERQEDDCQCYYAVPEIINLPAALSHPRDHIICAPVRTSISDLPLALGIETARAWVTLKDRPDLSTVRFLLGRICAMKHLLLVILSVLAILTSFPARGWYAPADAQDGEPFAVGDSVVVVAAQLPVHVQPDSSSGVAAELLYGMKSRVIGIEVDADGMPWYYLAEYAYGWVPELVEDQRSLMPFSEEALDKMLAETTAAIEANPEDVEAYVKRGTVYLVRREYLHAIGDYELAVQLRPDDAALHDYLGKAYMDFGQFSLARAQFRTAIDLGRSLANTYNRLAIALENLSEEGPAIQYYQKAIDTQPGYGLVYANQGRRIYQYRGDSSTAWDLYNRAIEIDPYLAIAYIYRGDLFSDSSDTSTYPQAFEDYNQALAIDPGSALAYGHRGGAYLFSGDWVQAEADFLRAAELDPYYEYPIWHLAALYGSMGRYEDAVDYYTRVEGLGQFRQDSARLYRAQDYMMLGQYDLALADMDTFIPYVESYDSRSDFRITAYMVRAAIYLRLAPSDPAHYWRAAEDYRAAFEVDPNMARGFYTWGQAYGVMFGEEYVIEGLRAQLDLDSNDSEAWWQLATEYMQRGRFIEALRAYDQYTRVAEVVPSELDQLIATIADLTDS
jgi:tetratricopeptide (TPR) repeat protein